MVLAVRTTASPTAIWVICAVAVACLAFWLVMVMVYAAKPSVRHRRMPRMAGPVLGGMHLAEGGRSVAPNRELPAVLPDLGPAAEPGRGVPVQRAPAQRGARAPAEPVPAAAGALAGSGEPVPVQRTAQAGPGARAGAGDEAPAEPVPVQRTADADTSADTGAAGRH